MFTGLVEEVGTVRRLERTAAGGKLVVGARKVLEEMRLGDSIAVSGACLTVIAVGGDDFTVECMPETLSRTTLGTVSPGAEVNLERSLKLGDRLGGHLVMGHVDSVSEALSVERRGIALEVTLSLPDEVRPYLAAKGSVALDGISLTVITAESSEFSVGLIPHTLSATTLRNISKGVRVNVEADVLARYVRRSLDAAGMASLEVARPVGLTEDLLRDKGFI